MGMQYDNNRRSLVQRAYHSCTMQCVCGNTLCFVEANAAVCDDCGAMYVPVGGNQSAYGYPKVSNDSDNNNIWVTETFMLDPHTINEDVLERLGQVEYGHTFVWEM
ncbi:MAG: hypothetical protein GY934_09760 [Gammaproteobacteria bacterium]|nr:hypothetical protein [Gammaproteobacteria bacterium]